MCPPELAGAVAVRSRVAVDPTPSPAKERIEGSHVFSYKISLKRLWR